MSADSLKIGEIQYMGSEQNSKNGYTPLATTKTQRKQKKSQAGPRFQGQNQLVNRIHQRGGESNG